MWDDALRGMKEIILTPIARWLLSFITPNQMTILGLVLGLASAWCFVLHLPFAGIILWGLNRVADGLDGTLARVTNTQSDLGGFLDIVCDLVVYASIPVGLTFSQCRLQWTGRARTRMAGALGAAGRAVR